MFLCYDVIFSALKDDITSMCRGGGMMPLLTPQHSPPKNRCHSNCLGSDAVAKVVYSQNHFYSHSLQTTSKGSIWETVRQLKLFFLFSHGHLARSPERQFGLGGKTWKYTFWSHFGQIIFFLVLLTKKKIINAFDWHLARWRSEIPWGKSHQVNCLARFAGKYCNAGSSMLQNLDAEYDFISQDVWDAASVGRMNGATSDLSVTHYLYSAQRVGVNHPSHGQQRRPALV